MMTVSDQIDNMVCCKATLLAPCWQVVAQAKTENNLGKDGVMQLLLSLNAARWPKVV